MRPAVPQVFPRVSPLMDPALIDGSLGVFAGHWIEGSQEPEHSGNYLVVVRAYEPVIAPYFKGRGWDLAGTLHLGLEHLIRWWMELPEPPKGRE